MKTKQLLKDRIHYHRTSTAIVGAAILVLVVTSFYAFFDGESLAGVEIWVFNLVNRLPDWLETFFIFMTNAATLGAIIVAALIALITKHRRIGLALMLSGGLGWLASHLLKEAVTRARPSGFIEDVIVRYTTLSAGYGFPSGHTTVAAAVAMALALILPRKYAPLLIFAAFIVGVSRVYLGVHLPLDVVSGWCVGIIVGYAVDFFLRVERQKAPENKPDIL